MLGLAITLGVLAIVLGCWNFFLRADVIELKEDLEATDELNRDYLKMVEDAQQKTRKYQKENSRLRKHLSKPQEDDNTDYLDRYLGNRKTKNKVTLDIGKIEVETGPGRLETLTEKVKV